MSTVKKFPSISLRATFNTSSGTTRCGAELRRTLCSGNNPGRCTAYQTAPDNTASTLKAISALAMLRSSGALSHMRQLQHLHHQLFETDARLPRRHRHQAVVGHARRGVDLQQVGLAALAHQKVDAPP